MAEEDNDNLSDNTISETVNEQKSSTENLRVLENIDWITRPYNSQFSILD